MFTFDKQSVQRIQNAVLTVEAWKRTQPVAQPQFRPGGFAVPQVMLAVEDIEHDTIGLAKTAEGSAWDDYLTTIGDAVEVYNPGPKVWNGSRLAVDICALRGCETRKRNIRHAWSATRIRGMAGSDITAGSSGTLNAVTAIDGYYGPSSADAFLPAGLSTVNAGTYVSADLVFGGSSSQWEIEPQSTGSSPTAGTLSGFEQYFAPNTLYELTYDEDRLVPFDEDNLLGSTGSATWHDAAADKFFILEPSDWFFHLAFQMTPDDSDPAELDSGAYIQLEEANVDDDGNPVTWSAMEPETNRGRVNASSPYPGVWSTASRDIIWSNDTRKAVRLVCGRQKYYGTITAHINYVGWHLKPSAF